MAFTMSVTSVCAVRGRDGDSQRIRGRSVSGNGPNRPYVNCNCRYMPLPSAPSAVTAVQAPSIVNVRRTDQVITPCRRLDLRRRDSR